MPIPERLLWGKLRDRRLAGIKFRRQQPVGPYVADFYCPSARLVIELVGRSHLGRYEADRERQDYLEQRGLRVIRFSNDRLLDDLAGVVRQISRACGVEPPPWTGTPRLGRD